MQYNIFKVKSKQQLIEEMVNKGFTRARKKLKSGSYDLSLFFKYDDDQRLNWKNIFDEFEERNVPKKTGLSSVVLCESSNSDYAITYGSSSFLVQKNSEREFGFDFAKRIELKEMKRKSSMSPHSNKNSSITSFKHTRTVLFDIGENITSLSFTPANEFYGKRVDIGKSIKFNVNLLLTDIYKLLDSIEIEMLKPVLNKIPLLTKVTNEEDITRYYDQMYTDLNDGYQNYLSFNHTKQFSVNEFSVVGSSFYFDDDHTKLVKIGRFEKEMELHDINDLFSLSKENNLAIQNIIESGKIVYKDSSGQRIYSEHIRKFINYEIENESVSLYDGEWYYYNQDYYELIMNEISTIKVEYDENDNMSKLYLDRIPGDDYREEKINKILSDRHKGILMDRDLVISKYENEFFESKYKIEIADLIIGKEYISVKVGAAASLSYCIDQSELSAKLIDAKKIDLISENLPVPEKYGVWFYLENNKFFKDGKCDIRRLGSIMLLSKLSNWSKNIKMYGKQPIIHVNKYEK